MVLDPSRRFRVSTIFGEYHVVAYQEEGTCKDSDDGDHEGGQGGARRGVDGEGEEGRWRWEHEVAPLWTREATKALRTIFRVYVGYPYCWVS